MKSNMYSEAKTWTPFQGCRFDCSYCKPTFKAQAKRQKHNCKQCYNYEPHIHEERLKKLPPDPIIFVCGSADISFCPVSFTRRIIETVSQPKYAKRIFYFQSKCPKYFERFFIIVSAECHFAYDAREQTAMKDTGRFLRLLHGLLRDISNLRA